MKGLARLDTMVTVVDVASFAENFASLATMGESGEGKSTENVVDLLIS